MKSGPFHTDSNGLVNTLIILGGILVQCGTNIFEKEKFRGERIWRGSIFNVRGQCSLWCLGTRSPNHVTTVEHFDWHCTKFNNATKTCQLSAALPMQVRFECVLLLVLNQTLLVLGVIF